MDNKNLYNEQSVKKFKELKTDSSSTNMFLLGLNMKDVINNIQNENTKKDNMSIFHEFLEKILKNKKSFYIKRLYLIIGSLYCRERRNTYGTNCYGKYMFW